MTTPTASPTAAGRRTTGMPPSSTMHAETGRSASLAATCTRPPLWSDAQEVFAPLAAEELLVHEALLPSSMAELHAEWQHGVRPVLEPVAGTLPDAAPSGDGGGRRPEDFAWLHGEF